MTPRKRPTRKTLAPVEKYQIWLTLLRGENTIIEAANTAGVDRATINRIRDVAKAGALDALARSKPGRGPKDPRDIEVEGLTADNTRLKEALAEMGVRLMLAEGKETWG